MRINTLEDMPILKFRIYWEEDESIYRDIQIMSSQHFLQLHQAILQAFEFDQKHKATFFRSNDHWQRGREIILEMDDQPHKAPPLLMANTTLADMLRNPNQKFVYLYDYQKSWIFLIELIAVTAETKTNRNLDYPVCVRKEGPPPSQYGNKKPVKDQIVETEEQYDLNKEDNEDGYGEEGEDGLADSGDAGGEEEIF
jgi:hypothetical protein